MTKKTLLAALLGLGILTSPIIYSQVHAANQQTTPSSSIMRSVTPKKQGSKANDSQVVQSSKPAKSVSSKESSQVSKPSKAKPSKRTKRGHRVLQKRIDNELADSAHYDENRSQIGGMKSFAKQRSRYYYPQIGFNTRDLGGYLTANGRYRVKNDRILRSAGLAGISNDGIQSLNRMGVHQDIDLRYAEGQQGIQNSPDPDELKSKVLANTKIKFQNAPVYSHQESKQMRQGIRTNGEWYFYGWPAVTNPNAIKAYRQVFRDLLNNRRGAVLYHCNVGRDRTGTVSALILSSLGVKRNVIYHDYLLTDYYRHQNDGKKLVPYDKQAGELKHFFATIDHKYGSVDHYLQSKIGLNKQELNQLKKLYLTPVQN